MNTAEKYIRIEEIGKSDTGKTRRWQVWNKRSSEDVGRIKWYGGFRAYVFFPKDEGYLYDASCLRMIADFLDGVNAKKRKEKKI